MILEIEIGSVLVGLLRTALMAYLGREIIRAVMIIVISQTQEPELEDEDPLEAIV